MTFPIIQRPNLPPATITPVDESLFVPYLNQIYEDIANSINARDFNYFTTAITSIASNIPNLPNFGAYIICVSGQSPATDGSTLPCITASLCKSSASIAGSIAVLGSQPGQNGGIWGGSTLTISATSTNFQINHSVTGVSGNFNIRIIGTQG
jgi:hypothetical protein